MILALRTDQSQAELYILSKQGKQLAHINWQAHRQLSDTIFHKLEELFAQAGCSYKDLRGLIVYKGPGSFTGLRIGITVANTLANGLNIPIVGSQNQDWLKNAVERLKNSHNDQIVKPLYGGEANITKPRK